MGFFSAYYICMAISNQIKVMSPGVECLQNSSFPVRKINRMGNDPQFPRSASRTERKIDLDLLATIIH